MHSITFTIPALVVDIFVLIPAYLFVGLGINLLQKAWIKVMSTKDAYNEIPVYTVLAYAVLWPLIVGLQTTVKIFRIDLTGVRHISWNNNAPRGGYTVSKEIRDSLKGLKVGDKVRLSYLPSNSSANETPLVLEGTLQRAYSKLGLKRLSVSDNGGTGYFLNENKKLIRNLVTPVVKL